MHHAIRRVLGLGLGASVLATLALAGTVSAANTYALHVAYDNDCVNIDGPAGATGVVRHRTSGGTLIDHVDVTLGLDGIGVACFDSELVAGQKIQPTIDGVTRTMTLPKFSIRINRSTDVISGAAPAGRPVKLTVAHFTSFSGFAYYHASKTASSSGTYSRDVTSIVNIAGGDLVSGYTTLSSGDSVSTREITPRIKVWIGRSHFGSQLMSGTGGTVTLRNASGTYRASGGTSWLELDSVIWDNAIFLNDGTPKSPRVGDRITSSIQSNMSFTIPNLSLTIDTADDGVSGSCPASRWVFIEVTNDGAVKYTDQVKCSAGGTYSRDMTGDHDLVAAERVEVVARLSTGDQVAIRKVAS